ncbi:MAG: AMP-binding protein [Myxococcota bacterium]
MRERLGDVGRGAKNALELVQRGRLSAPYSAPYEVAHQGKIHKLRHYATSKEAAASTIGPVLLVPPLMVTSEIYDISPELSAVTLLRERGADVWVVDFGAPERVEGGTTRTLDDHILATEHAIRTVRKRTKRDVHVAGYSQGGLFAYQAAAYLKSKHVASIVTFGAPVDLRRALPVRLHDDLAGRVLHAASQAISAPLDRIEGLPGMLTSRGFKLFNARKELKHVVGILGILHDREALAEREPKRRFLGGEGFVAWPGPALKQFVDDIVANNRLTQGGMIVGGRSIALVDLDVPILTFVGERDEMARPASVRAISRAAPDATVHERDVRAGHFGLVVGSRAMGEVWPTVADWLEWHERGATGTFDARYKVPEDDEAAAGEEDALALIGPLYEIATDTLDAIWNRLGDVSLDVADTIDALRWQLPRLAKLRQLEEQTRINLGRALTEQAHAIGDKPFLLWRAQAISYAEVEARAHRLAHVLWHTSGVRQGDHVAVWMHPHPDVLVATAALNRIGAVAVLLDPAGSPGATSRALRQLTNPPAVTLIDASHVGMGELLPDAAHYILGADDTERAIASSPPTPHGELAEVANCGRAEDVAMILFTAGTTGAPRAVPITNRRWSLCALGCAAACKLTSRDTVYSCVPMHHGMGMLIACSGALVGGTRLALAPRFAASTFWNDVRRYGASVVFTMGHMSDAIVAMSPSNFEAHHPVRLFAGIGTRSDTWRAMLSRLSPVEILEFYASTEGNVCVANLTGDKPGSMGRALPGMDNIALVRVDHTTRELVRDDCGRLVRCAPDEVGMLIGEISTARSLFRFDGYIDDEATKRAIATGCFEDGDQYFVTGDLARSDADGDLWFVDRIDHAIPTPAGYLSSTLMERALTQAPFVDACVVYPVLEEDGGVAPMAAITLTPRTLFDGEALYELTRARLAPSARPRYVRIVDHIQRTATHQPITRTLVREGASPARVPDAVYARDERRRTYTLDP